jgi:YD repeat-containing protein
MKTNPSIACFLTGILLCCIIKTGAAQEKIATLLPPPAKIAVDGEIKEWGDSLRYYYAGKHLNYALANTKDTLYMAIRFNDRVDQMRVLRSGLTLSIDPKGKKKEAFSITFPLDIGGNASTNHLHDDSTGGISKQDREELMRERVTTLRGIKVTGFKDVEDEMITTSNTYGFQTAVNYDDNGYLVCEAAIPLSLFHADDLNKNEWSFNFKINGVERKLKAESGEQEGGGGHSGRGGGSGGGHRGGRGGGSGGNESQSSEQAEMAKSADFWVKYYLAK